MALCLEGVLTQLLCHYNDIYEALHEGKRLDTVFLDFAKAFDKVDHNILLEKVKKHGIGGKIGRWIMEFLNGRKFRVVANDICVKPGYFGYFLAIFQLQKFISQ